MANTQENADERMLIRFAMGRRYPEVRRLLGQVKDLYFDSYKSEKRGNDTMSGTVIHALAFSGMCSAIEDLVRCFGFSVNVGRKFDGATALHIACLHGNADTVETLLKLNADITRMATGGRGVVGYALSGPPSDREKILETLKRHAIRIYGEPKAKELIGLIAHGGGNRNLQPPILTAASYACAVGIELLVWANEDPNHAGFHGKNALHWLVSGRTFGLAGGLGAHRTINSPEQMAAVVRSLVKNGADPNARVQARSDPGSDADEVGMTALHLLAASFHGERWALPTFTALLELGAEPSMLDGKGRSVMAVAAENRRIGLIHVLVPFGFLLDE